MDVSGTWILTGGEDGGVLLRELRGGAQLLSCDAGRHIAVGSRSSEVCSGAQLLVVWPDGPCCMRCQHELLACSARAACAVSTRRLRPQTRAAHVSIASCVRTLQHGGRGAHRRGPCARRCAQWAAARLGHPLRAAALSDAAGRRAARRRASLPVRRRSLDPELSGPGVMKARSRHSKLPRCSCYVCDS